jgi:acetoacetyl-CoA synthetase
MTKRGLREPIWVPDRSQVEASNIVHFAKTVAREGAPIADPLDYRELWNWSVEHGEDFWAAVWQFYKVRTWTPYETVLAARTMPGAEWFPGATVNYAERALTDAREDGLALIAVAEDGSEQSLSWGALRREVGALAAALRRLGVVRGDRVVGYLPNGSQAVIAFLATASLGAVWSQCAQDYAAPAALGRFAQLEPTVLIAADGYRYNGRVFDRRDEVSHVRAGLPTVRHTILVPHLGLGSIPATDDTLSGWDDAVGTPAELDVEAVPFDHPLWVLFSSGTTGPPKGIVHGHGGVLLGHLAMNGLHLDLGSEDRFFWYTSTNWMMWNVVVSGLLTGSTIIVYDGSPTFPDAGAMWRLVADLRVTVFGTSPGQLLASAKAGLSPGTDLDLSQLRIIGSTGSPLPAASYQWVHDQIGADVQVCSISGGTDVVAAFCGSAPTTPVWAGELSAPCLGVALEAWDESGKPCVDQIGELVVTAPMPSMPIEFWNDPDGERYHEAYFDTYPGVWRHGDWITITDRGSVIFHGRSDATLNRHGVRLGSAEIYEATEELPQIVEALVVGVDEPGGGYWMPLFVVPADGIELDDTLRAAINGAIRAHASPRHVPDEIIAVPAIPHTRTGKKLEVAVKRLLQGAELEQVLHLGATENPEALDLFAALASERRSNRPPEQL